MERILYTITKVTESTDEDRTIETLADEVKDETINRLYIENDQIEPNQNHDRITIVTTVIIED